MIRIVKATIKECEVLEKISKQAFLESHGHSASKEDVDLFIHKTYSKAAFTKELLSSKNEYHLIYFNNQIAGYSKIVCNSPNINVTSQNITKLDRLYLLKKFYGQNLGKKIFDFNIELSKRNGQKGIWLAVWVKNFKAIRFYEKMGFKIVGDYNFKISEQHSNPNHIMFLAY